MEEISLFRVAWTHDDEGTLDIFILNTAQIDEWAEHLGPPIYLECII